MIKPIYPQQSEILKQVKMTVRKILSRINPDLEYQAVDQFHFNQLKKEPPELMWKALRPGPEARLDAAGIPLGHEWFVFGGFHWDKSIIKFVHIFDFRKEKWVARIPLPKDAPQTHQGMTSDGKRYIYSVAGQLGPHCCPPAANAYVFDTLNRSWKKFVPLPKARYAPATQLWNGRIHAVAGSKEDRNEPSVEHWSIAVKDGKPLESQWRQEPPIPRGGVHRASAVIDNKLYVFGGQEGDYMATPGDCECRCMEVPEDVFADTYMLEPGASQWKRMADMPVSSSHTEFTVIHFGQSIVLMGGQQEKHPVTGIVKITDAIQAYDAQTDTWRIVGRLPYGVKETVAAYYDGSLYMSTGQRWKGPDDPTPMNRFERGLWKAQFSLTSNLSPSVNSADHLVFSQVFAK